MNMNGICRLCGASSGLRESHIFPKCFIRLVRRETTDNRFYEMSRETSRLVQDGPKEHLLCGQCEQQLGRYEKYSKEAFHESRHGIQVLDGGPWVTITGLDYRKTKLFLLSVIYRMSVSSLRQFKDVALGEYEDVVRRMLIAEDPGSNDQYPIGAIVPLIKGNVEECVLCTPSVCRRDVVTVYTMIIGGIFYLFFVPRLSPDLSMIHSVNAQLGGKWILNESGTWVMPKHDLF